MKLLAALAVLVAFVVAVEVHAARASSASSLRQSIRSEVRRVEQAKTTLRFFTTHGWLLYSKSPRVKRRAWHDVGVARQRVIAGRARLVRLRSELKRAQPIPHYQEWLCIHHYEGAWDDPNAPYYGGLQMDLEFQTTYGLDFYRAKGTADHWTPREQMLVAERAYRSGRGFGPWPNTARMCGLL